MNTNLKKLMLIGVVLSLAALACNLPGSVAPTPILFPTPDLTLTALFAQITPPVDEVASPTAMTETQAPTPTPSETPLPSNSPEPSFTSPPPTATVPPATATTAPTNTPISYVGPGVRPGASITAAYLQAEPNIDGVFDEWSLDRYDVAYVVYGANSWNGENDAYANVMVGWDDNYLYIAAKVKDDRYVQNTTGKNIFKGDSLEILMDTNVSNDFYLQSLSGDDYQIGISPGNPQPGTNPEAYVWYPQSQAGTKTKVKTASTFTANGYRVETKIPWSIFGVTPAKGQHFGFAISFSDNDNPNKNVQQTIVSNVSTRSLTDPTTWGDLTLSGAPVVAPAYRSGTSVTAAYMATAPTIDANLGEWSWSPFSINHVVYGADKWNNAADLSGNAMVGWDNSYLYLAVKVVDNQYVQNASGVNLFLGDSLDLVLDQNVSGDYYVQSLNTDDDQLGISPGFGTVGNSPEAYLWYPKASAGTPSGVSIAAVATADGYNIEVAIPWSVLGATPSGGKHFGFALSISDNDNENRPVQQSMVSNVAGKVLADPTTWGDLTLASP